MDVVNQYLKDDLYKPDITALTNVLSLYFPILTEGVPAEYTVTFNSNGGNAVRTKSIMDGNAIGKLPKTTRTGYKFEGWYTAKSGGEKVLVSAIVNGSITLFAHWTAKKYTVKLNVNGGKKLSTSNAKKTATYAKPYGKFLTPQRSGYKFNGWWTKKSGGAKITAKSKVKITKTTTLYAHWKKL
jgi:uncharacterized repeat protein (TIGR02543 family)